MKKVLFDTCINELMVFDLDNLSISDNAFLNEYESYLNYASYHYSMFENIYDLNVALRAYLINVTHDNINQFYEYMDEDNKKRYEEFL